MRESVWGHRRSTHGCVLSTRTARSNWSRTQEKENAEFKKIMPSRRRGDDPQYYEPHTE